MTAATLDIREAAEMMKVHPKTVQDLITSGALPAGRVGRAYVLLTKDVLAHIEFVISKHTAERLGGVPRRRRRSTLGAS